MHALKLPTLYPITDVRLTRLKHAEQVACLGAGGATLVQLREKHLSPREFYGQAEESLAEARRLGARIIINDRADVALALRADGVHLGQDDLGPEAARALLGEDAIIGYSTHGVEQAREAARRGVSYVAIGPVFATGSKENPDPVVGLEGVRRARAVIGDTPLVAIGGITREHARAVLNAGADSVAVISALLVPSDPDAITRRTREILASLRL